MRKPTRRQFMQATGAAVASSLIADAVPAEISAATGVHTRTLGKTGLECSLLGMGTGTRSWGGSSDQNRLGREAFVRLLEFAYGRGVTYFDMADMYGAHDYMKDAIQRGVPREKLMLLTKTVSRTPELIRADLERFRKEADTDYFDIVLLHCLTEPGWDRNLQGCKDALSEAKHRSLIRAHGVSCHNLECMREAAESAWVDVILARFNPYGVKMDGAPDEVATILRTARSNGKGVLGMKILGEGELAEKRDACLKFALTSGCVDAMTIGFLAPAEIDDVLARIASPA